MKHSVTDEQLEINTELNDLKYQLIEEGMENYKLRQKIKMLKAAEDASIKNDVVVFMIGLGLGILVSMGI